MTTNEQGMLRPPAAPPQPLLGDPAALAPAVVVTGVTKTYGSTVAIDNVTLSVPQGSVYALVGPNGSGKTTLFKLLAGLVRPDSGTMAVMGEPVRAGERPPGCLAFVPDGCALYDYMTVVEHTAFAAQFAQRWDSGFAQRSLQGLGLPLHKRVGQLSQGQRTQVALVLALSQRPDLLILDEPTANLDPIRRREVHRLVIGEASARGQTILLSSHNLTEVERVADRVGFLRQGRLIAERLVDEIKESDHEVRVVLQGPPTTDLAALPGVQVLEQKGHTYRLRVSGELEPVLAALQQMNPFALDVVDQTLEDLFFAYNTPERPPDREEG